MICSNTLSILSLIAGIRLRYSATALIVSLQKCTCNLSSQALDTISQSCLHIAAAWSSFLTRHIEFSCNNRLLHASLFEALCKMVDTFHVIRLLFTIGIEHQCLLFCIEQQLQMSIDLTGYVEMLTIDSLLQLNLLPAQTCLQCFSCN